MNLHAKMAPEEASNAIFAMKMSFQSGKIILALQPQGSYARLYPLPLRIIV